MYTYYVIYSSEGYNSKQKKITTNRIFAYGLCILDLIILK